MSIATEVLDWVRTPANLPFIGLGISIIALIVTTTNAFFGIRNVILSRRIVLKIINLSTLTSSDSNNFVERTFYIDLLSRGAPIWDLSVEMAIECPYTKEFIEAGFTGTIVLRLIPAQKINPLAHGQSIRFQLKLKGDTGPWPNQEYAWSRFRRASDLLKPKDISLRIYSNDPVLIDSVPPHICSQPRRLLKTIRSWRFNWAVEAFLHNKIVHRSLGPNGISMNIIPRPQTIWQRSLIRALTWKQYLFSWNYRRRVNRQSNAIKKVQEETARRELQSNLIKRIEAEEAARRAPQLPSEPPNQAIEKAKTR